jgi:hypothetical protein
MLRAGGGGGGGNNKIRRAFWSLAVNQTFPSGAQERVVNWDHLISDPHGLYDIGRGDFENSCGYTWVRMSMGIAWPLNGVGYRSAAHHTGGAIREGVMRDIRQANNVAMNYTIVGQWASATSNETQNVFVAQTSGGNLDLLGGIGATWVLFECARPNDLDMIDVFPQSIFACTGP